MRYVIDRYADQQREIMYRIYLTDVLRLIAKGGNEYPAKRYADIINPPPEDNRTGDEIAQDVIKKLGLVVK